MPAEIIIIAGPQAAGKSTVITQLVTQYQNVTPFLSRTKKQIPVMLPLQESRQIIVHKNVPLGGIFMTVEDEKEVVECDLKRMDLILERNDDNRLTYLDECNIFTIAHAAAHGVTQISDFWEEYMRRLEKLDAKVIFLDVPPEVSWFRRQQSYRDRLIYFPKNQHEEIMTRFRKYLEKLCPELLNLYEELPLPKRKINANCPIETVLQKTGESLVQISSFFQKNA